MRRLWPALLLLACSSRPDLDSVTPDLTQLGRSLPPGFLMGTATAAHQVEGGNNNDWTDWENPDAGHIANGDVSGLADDSWNRFDQDLGAMQQLHANGYRFSIEWSRIQPTEDTWDFTALEHYHQMLRTLRANGITPMVTLMHFTLPKWVAATGGWDDPATIDRFDTFVRAVVPVLAGDVDFWCVLNEPNVYATSAYLTGEFPPGVKDNNAQMARVLSNQLKAHARAAVSIRELDTIDIDADGHSTRIGIAHHVRIFQPATTSALDTTIAGLTDDFFNEAVPRANATGHIILSQPGSFDIDEEVPNLKGSFDWLGLNYYSRDYIRADLGNAALSNMYVPAGRPTSDLGWDLYATGLYQSLLRFNAWGLPLYVTENGIADAAGTNRPLYLSRHLNAMEQAFRDGADVRGYFHWALMDNFEWAQGFSPRFGLFTIDYADPMLTRKPTPAVETFRTVADNAAQ